MSRSPDSVLPPAALLPAAGSGVANDRTAEQGELAAEIFPLVVRQMASLIGQNRGELEDLVQIAAEQALRSLPSFERRSALSTWTYRICYITLLKHYRWRARFLRRFRLTNDGELPERATETSSAPDALEAAERGCRLWKALAGLAPKRRTVVILHDLEGLSIPIISEIVGAKEATVRSRLRDGRRLLAERLTDDPYFGDEACRPTAKESAT